MFLKTLCAARAVILNLFQDLSGLLTTKTLLIMNFTAIILISACLTASATGFSQITLAEKNVPLQKIFKELQKQSGYDFLFSSTLLEKAGNATVTVKNVSLKEAVEEVLKGKNLTYEIVEKTVIIKPKPTAVISNERSEEKSPAALVDIKGRVVNEQNEPIPGASITLKSNKTIGTSTNPNGEFTLTGVDENATLVITAVSISPLEIKVAAILSLSKGGIAIISTKTKITALNEVIINKGYYTEKQKYSVGNVGHIDGKDIEKQPVSNPLLALQGRIPGLVVTQESGITGGPVTIRIQGKNSISNGNDPLIVIDGVPYPTTMLRTGLENVLGTNLLPSPPSPLNYINPADILSIDVLKDADATAIYGSRAANGAILITTKKGKAGLPRFNINLQQGWGAVARKVEMLNTRQYLDMRYEAYRNDGIDWKSSTVSANDLKVWDTTRYTNWQNELIGGTALFTNVNATFSGGTNLIQYTLGGTYQRQTTVFPGDFADNRGTLHFSLNSTSANKKFKLQFLGNYMTDNNRLPNIDLTQKAILFEPVAPVLFNSDGSLNWATNASNTSTWDNPLIDVLYRKYNNNTNNLVSNLQLNYELLPGLDIKSSFGFTKTVTNDFVSTPILAIRPENRNVSPNPRQAGYGFRNVNTWIIEPQISYQKQFSKGKLDGLLGFSIQQNENHITNIIGSGYPSDESLKNSGAAVSLTSRTSYVLYKYNALFGRLNYNWQNKYIMNLTGRRDGSSRFGDRNKFENFGSLGLAWIFSESKFIQEKIPYLSFGKLRASYGTTGSDQIGDYAYLNLYGNITSSVPYQNSSSLMPNGLPNPYLEWEQTTKWQIGSDLGFFKDRLLIAATYALNRSSNQLLLYALPSITGFNTISDNFPATVQNSSWEFSLNTTNIKNSTFSWMSSFNITIPRNKLLSFPNLQTSSYASSLIVGQPIDVFKAYHYLGVDPATGKYLVADKDGNPTTSSTSIDRTVLINTQPTLYGGWQNSFQFNSIELDFLFQFVKQTGDDYFYNNGTSLNPGVFSLGSSNQPTTILNHWQKVGDRTATQRYTSGIGTLFNPLSNATSSDANYIDASFIRLKNLSLSYSLPTKWVQKLHLQNCQLYMRGQNVFTMTKYRGLDPETRSIRVLPPLRMITAGVLLGF